MHGLSLTYQTLAQTPNVAAVDVLLAGIDSSSSSVVTMALRALVQRTEPSVASLNVASLNVANLHTAQPKAAEQLLLRWGKLNEKQIAIVQSAEGWMDEAVLASLCPNCDEVEVAITAAGQLQLSTAGASLIELAQSSASRALRQLATDTLVALVTPMGEAARNGSKPNPQRGPLMAQLADSVRTFSAHRNEGLVDAFLAISNWGDGDLRQMIGGEGDELTLLCDRLQRSPLDAVTELLAGFIRRRSPHRRLLELIQSREDESFRDHFLDKISSTPSATTLQNLKEGFADQGLPTSCGGGVALVQTITPKRRAALIHVHSSVNPRPISVMQVIVSAVQLGGPGCEVAAGVGLGSCEILDIDYWMRAAVPVADDDQEEIAADENAQLLYHLIELLDHEESGIAEGVRRALGPMHAEAMLPRMAILRPRSRRRLGRVVMMIDPLAIERVGDALRHPVLEKRMEAIAMADALALVDLLSDSFTHISREDHQQARICAAEAMADASSETTMQLLEEMVSMPVSPVRDAAVIAMECRQKRQKKTLTRR